MNRLVLIDGNAILHRAYHALPPLTSRSGQLVNAVYGFCTMLLKVVADLTPTHLAVAFDTEKPTFRHAAYVGYQAHRPRLESDLASQIAITQEMLVEMDIPVYLAAGYEADDVIGTLVAQFRAGPAARSSRPTSSSRVLSELAGGRRDALRERHPLEVIIVTGDRDLLQLVNKNVKVYAPVKGLTEAWLFDREGVKEYLGVPPEQIIDYKALVGDQSDNYPGVAGIGPKTAVALLADYGSLENIYQHLADIKNPTLVGKLAQGSDSAALSKQLATINKEAPVTLDLSQMEYKGIVHPKALEKLRQLGFKSLVARLAPTAVQKRSTNKITKDQMNLL